MPPTVNILNPPPHPFWEFVANIEDHPFFAQYGQAPTGSGRFRQNVPNQQQDSAQSQEASTTPKSEKTAGKQATVEDENDAVGPSATPGVADTHDGKSTEEVPEQLRGIPFRGRGRFAPREGEEDQEQHQGGPCRRGGMHGRCGQGGPHGYGLHRHGPPPMGGPWWAHRGPPPPFGPGPQHRGPPHGPPHHHHGPHGPPSPSGSPRHHRGPRAGPGNFNVGEFLNTLGSRLGVDLSGAAEGFGLEHYNAGTHKVDADFEPRADVFDTPTNYTIHLSLPGAKKDDLGVEWVGENSVLRISGVVYRPGADEEMLKYLAVDGRKREVGVFEKNIRLGTKRDPASIDVAGINAKMMDGVLVVKVPKIAIEHKKREVPITEPEHPSPAREIDMEKGTLIDTEGMYDDPAVSVPELGNEKSTVEKEKEAEAQQGAEKTEDTRSETMEVEHEELPEYEAEKHEHGGDYEHEDSGDEGEYVKINVD